MNKILFAKITQVDAYNNEIDFHTNGALLKYWRIGGQTTGLKISTTNKLWDTDEAHVAVIIAGPFEIVTWVMHGLHLIDPTHTHMSNTHATPTFEFGTLTPTHFLIKNRVTR